MGAYDLYKKREILTKLKVRDDKVSHSEVDLNIKIFKDK